MVLAASACSDATDQSPSALLTPTAQRAVPALSATQSGGADRHNNDGGAQKPERTYPFRETAPAPSKAPLELAEACAAAERELELSFPRYTEAHPTMQRIRAQLRECEEQTHVPPR